MRDDASPEYKVSFKRFLDDLRSDDEGACSKVGLLSCLHRGVGLIADMKFVRVSELL